MSRRAWLLTAVASSVIALGAACGRPGRDRSAGRCSPAPTAAGAHGGESGERFIGQRTHASYAAVRDGGSMRGFVVFARGAPGWRQGGPHGGSGEMAGGPAGPGPMRMEWSVGRVRYAVEYDPQTDTLRIAGRSLALREGNVLLLDRVDGRGGPPAVQAAGCVALEPAASAVERALAELPAARRFAR